MKITLAVCVSFVAALAFADGPKNLQVLPKNMPKEQVKQTMKQLSKDLGVECDFCHDVPDMAADTNKMKTVARQMMRMQMDINDKWMKGIGKEGDKKKVVTCGTCHRGKEEPPPFGG